jgi:hypothetical protein
MLISNKKIPHLSGVKESSLKTQARGTHPPWKEITAKESAGGLSRRNNTTTRIYLQMLPSNYWKSFQYKLCNTQNIFGIPIDLP